MESEEYEQLVDGTTLFTEFINENYNKLIKFDDYSIDIDRRDEYIRLNYEIDSDIGYVVEKLAKSIKYVDIKFINHHQNHTQCY